MLYKGFVLLHQQGFTIIELVVVMVIISILAIVPLFNWPGTVISLDAQADQFVNDVRYTQAQAMSKSERYRIVRTSATSYQIQDGNGTAVPMASGSATLTLASGFTFGTWSGLSSNLIAFDGRGRPYQNTTQPGTPLTPGSTYTITISGGGNTKTISITPITGRVVST